MENKFVAAIAYTALLTFIIWGVFDFGSQIFIDRMISIMIIISGIIYADRLGITSLAAATGFLALILHNINLYNQFVLRVSYDHYVHFVAIFAVCLVFYEYLKKGKRRSNHIEIALIAICISAGIGSFMEITEFLGFSHLGHGEGILFYGDGDWGEWNNASWDMIYNTLGAIFAALILYIRYHWKKPQAKLAAAITVSLILYLAITHFSYLAYDNNTPNSLLGDSFYTQTTGRLPLKIEHNLNHSIGFETGFAKANAIILLGRLKQDRSVVCESIPEFLRFIQDYQYSADRIANRKIALTYEEIAALNCPNTQITPKVGYLRAARIWEELNNSFRKDIALSLSRNKDPILYFKDSRQNSSTAKKLLNLTDKDNLSIMTPVNRFTRDIRNGIALAPDSGFTLHHIASKYQGSDYLNENLILEDKNAYKNAEKIDQQKGMGMIHKTSYGVLAAEFNSTWYYPDDSGIFRFQIDESEVMQPSTIFLRDNLVIIFDTRTVASIIQTLSYPDILRKQKDEIAIAGACKKSGAKTYLESRIKLLCLE